MKAFSLENLYFRIFQYIVLVNSVVYILFCIIGREYNPTVFDGLLLPAFAACASYYGERKRPAVQSSIRHN